MPTWYKKYMFVVGTCGQFVFYSQFFEIIQNQSSEGIPLFGFMCGLLSVSSWMVYGFMIRDMPLMISSTVGTIGALLTVGSILIYR